MFRFFTLCAISMISLQSVAREKLIIPIITNHNIPYVYLKINQKIIPFILDSGSSTGVHLTENDARSMDGLRYTGKYIESMDLSGARNKDKEFLIPKLDVDGMIFSNIKGKIFSPWGISLGKSRGPDPDTSVIGMGFFEDKKFIINLSRKKLEIVDTDSEIAGDLNEWISMPFQKTNEGYVLSLTGGKKHIA